MTEPAGTGQPMAPVQVFPLQLRWADLDLLGHVNNVRFLEYAQEARIKYLTLLDAHGVLPRRPTVVVRQEIDYDRVLELRDAPVHVRVQVAAVGRSSVTVEQVVETAPTTEEPGRDRVFARIRSVVVGFDAAAGRSVPLTDASRDALTALLDGAAGAAPETSPGVVVGATDR
ncbi:thioesterase family protein [Rhodococcus aerolatus]